MKISTIAQPALPQPLSVGSLNMSKRHRNHTMIAAIQMKNQKDQRSTSPKSFVMASMGRPTLASGSEPRSASAASVADPALPGGEPGPVSHGEASGEPVARGSVRLGLSQLADLAMAHDPPRDVGEGAGPQRQPPGQGPVDEPPRQHRVLGRLAEHRDVQRGVDDL